MTFFFHPPWPFDPSATRLVSPKGMLREDLSNRRMYFALRSIPVGQDRPFDVAVGERVEPQDRPFDAALRSIPMGQDRLVAQEGLHPVADLDPGGFPLAAHNDIHWGLLQRFEVQVFGHNADVWAAQYHRDV